MKYERRSVLDKNELLVDVRLPKMGIDDDEQEDEYLKPFKFDEAIGRDVLEKLDDGEDDDEDTDEYVGGLAPDHEEEEVRVKQVNLFGVFLSMLCLFRSKKSSNMRSTNRGIGPKNMTRTRKTPHSRCET